MLSPERKKFPPSFMTHQDMSSRKTFVFNCAQSENVCVMSSSSAVLCGVTVGTVNMIC